MVLMMYCHMPRTVVPAFLITHSYQKIKITVWIHTYVFILYTV